MSDTSVRDGAIWWTLTKERKAWCNLQVKLCNPCLSALRLCMRIKRRYINTLPFFSFMNSLLIIYCWVWQWKDFNKTTVQINLAKGRIVVLSPLTTANGFVRSWLPSNTWFLGSTRVNPPNGISIRSAVFCTAHPTCKQADRQTDRHTHHGTCDICSNRPQNACVRCGLKIDRHLVMLRAGV